MRRSFRLTVNQPSLSINVDFQTTAVVIDNPTGSPVFLRMGAPDIPNALNADLVAPAASSSSHATSGRDFGAALGDPTLIATSSSALSGLFNVVVITLLDAAELVPAYGSFSFLSLSLTDLRPLSSFTVGYIGPFDLGPWGGLNVLVLPGAGTGQGIAQVEVKQTAPDVTTGWSIYGQWAFWPGLPLSLTIPRTARYVRILLNNTTIPGEPAIGGSVAVRASLSEIAQLAATPGTTSLSKLVNVAALGSTSVYYATVGLRAVTVRVNVAVGTGAELVIYTSASPGGPWALATFREQNVQGFYNSIARTVGQLDAFLRLDVLDIAGGGLQTTVSTSIQESPDLTSYLQNIYSALGDTGQPVSVGQSIYSRLSQLYLAIGTGNLTTIESDIRNILGGPPIGDARVTTILNAIQTTLNSINNGIGLGSLTTILNNIFQSLGAGDLTVILTNIRTALGAGNLTTILNAINTAIGSGNLSTLLNAINTNLGTLVSQANNAVGVIAVNPAISLGSTWTSAGALLTPGNYITAAMVGYQIQGVMPDNSFIQLASGTAGAPVNAFYGSAPQQPEGAFAPMVYSSGGKSGGWLIPAGHTTLWAWSTAAPAFLSLNIGHRPP